MVLFNHITQEVAMELRELQILVAAVAQIGLAVLGL